MLKASENENVFFCGGNGQFTAAKTHRAVKHSHYFSRRPANYYLKTT